MMNRDMSVNYQFQVIREDRRGEIRVVSTRMSYDEANRQSLAMVKQEPVGSLALYRVEPFSA